VLKKQVIRDVKILHLILMVCLLTVISTASAQNPIEAVAGSILDQVNAAGQQIPENAVSHILEGNLTQEHIAQDLNATKENLTEQARAKINQKINENLNLTPEQLQQKAEEELKRQVSQRIQQQPGFEAALALLAALAAVSLIRRRG
jgi:PGF-CTERM protein